MISLCVALVMVAGIAAAKKNGDSLEFGMGIFLITGIIDYFILADFILPIITKIIGGGCG